MQWGQCQPVLHPQVQQGFMTYAPVGIVGDDPQGLVVTPTLSSAMMPDQALPKPKAIPTNSYPACILLAGGVRSGPHGNPPRQYMPSLIYHLGGEVLKTRDR
jgi:hypothetical protein